MKRLIALLLTSIIIAFNLASCTSGVLLGGGAVTDTKETRRDLGEYVLIKNYRGYTGKQYTKVLMGEYPQWEMAEDVTLTGETSADGYYLGSDGERYKEQGGKYYKIEPIMWSVVERYDGKMLLICDRPLFSSLFGDTTDYSKSIVREELNSVFINVAFTEAQRKLILTTTVDNSIDSTITNLEEERLDSYYDIDDLTSNPNVCQNTEDKIFILSRHESFKYSLWTDNIEFGTAYAGSSDWWLRSPAPNTVWDLIFVGTFTDHCAASYKVANVLDSSVSVVPAMWISEVKW